jgi:hypothetical protein
MRHFLNPPLGLLLALSAALASANPAQQAGSTPAKVTKATPAASATATGTANPGPAPNAGGSGGDVGSNKGVSGQQIGPKKPKCPDPLNTACPAVKAPISK